MIINNNNDNNELNNNNNSNDNNDRFSKKQLPGFSGRQSVAVHAVNLVERTKYTVSKDISAQKYSVSRDISAQKYSVGKDIPVQNIQSVRTFQYKIFSQ